jgi:hypothetical protein
MDLFKRIYLYNDSKETFEGKWDGEVVTIKPGKYEEMNLGIAEHFKKRHPSFVFRVEEVPVDVPKLRAVKNPLEDNSRGAAFEGLKRRKAAK